MQRLFVYGSLQPGGANAHELESIPGKWEPGIVRGRLVEDGWGARLGYPGLVLDEDAAEIRGHLLSSDRLDAHWERLDAFEGAQYRRTVTRVTLSDGRLVPACVYVLHPVKTPQGRTT